MIDFFDARLAEADRYGVRDLCIIDPGTGFAPPNWAWERPVPLPEDRLQQPRPSCAGTACRCTSRCPGRTPTSTTSCSRSCCASGRSTGARTTRPRSAPSSERSHASLSGPRGCTASGGNVVSQSAGTRSGATSTSGASTKRRSAKRGMGHGQLGRGDRDVVVEQQVEIERARAPVDDALAAGLGLDPLQAAHQREGVERRVEGDDHVQVRRPGRRARRSDRSRTPATSAASGDELVDGEAEVLLAIAEVAAERDDGAMRSGGSVRPGAVVAGAT